MIIKKLRNCKNDKYFNILSPKKPNPNNIGVAIPDTMSNSYMPVSRWSIWSSSPTAMQKRSKGSGTPRSRTPGDWTALDEEHYWSDSY